VAVLRQFDISNVSMADTAIEQVFLAMILSLRSVTLLGMLLLGCFVEERRGILDAIHYSSMFYAGGVNFGFVQSFSLTPLYVL
jgi:hypothetical protein